MPNAVSVHWRPWVTKTIPPLATGALSWLLRVLYWAFLKGKPVGSGVIGFAHLGPDKPMELPE